MNYITLAAVDTGITIVPNRFIDKYMSEANGACIKVYLYLLRCIHSDIPFSIQLIAKHINETENDVLRSLKYLEDKQLLELSYSSDGSICKITLKDEDLSSSYEQTLNETAVITSAPSNENINLEMPPKPDYTEAQIEKLKEIGEIKFIISTAEKYLARLLKKEDMQLLIYLYESLGFSTDLIIYLLEYCTLRNKKSSGYIESVALAWHAQGIDTVEKAENQSGMYNSCYITVNKAFGLNRTPGAAERNYINTWFNTYNFTHDIVAEACSRSLLCTGKPDFKYANSILEKWHKSGVVSLNDVKKLDEVHNAKAASQKNNIPSRQQAQNRFNAFPQRSYSGSDFDSIEKHVLNRSKNIAK